MQAFNFQVKWIPGKLHLIADSLSRAPNFSPHTDELTIETSFAVLNEEHPKCNQLLTCLAEHICPQYKDLLLQIQRDFSSKSMGPFASSYRKLGDRLSIYKFNDIEFVLLDSQQIIPPGAVRCCSFPPEKSSFCTRWS